MTAPTHSTDLIERRALRQIARGPGSGMMAGDPKPVIAAQATPKLNVGGHLAVSADGAALPGRP